MCVHVCVVRSALNRTKSDTTHNRMHICTNSSAGRTSGHSPVTGRKLAYSRYVQIYKRSGHPQNSSYVLIPLFKCVLCAECIFVVEMQSFAVSAITRADVNHHHQTRSSTHKHNTATQDKTCFMFTQMNWLVYECTQCEHECVLESYHSHRTNNAQSELQYCYTVLAFMSVILWNNNCEQNRSPIKQ